MRTDTIFEKMFFSTVRVESTSEAGSSTGTAFAFKYRQNDKEMPCLITNRHVIRGATSGRLVFTQKVGVYPSIGNRLPVEFPDFESMWFPHTTADVAILPLAPILLQLERDFGGAFLQFLDDSLIPSEEQTEELDAVEEVYFVGYPNGLFDEKNLMPIVRRGTTATPPQLNYNGEPAFLIDASVFGGSSGSPLMFVKMGGFDSRRNAFVVGGRVHLLGIVSGVIIRGGISKLELVGLPVPGIRTLQELNLGYVVKSSVIMETIREFVKIYAPPATLPSDGSN